jgi:alpha-L-fucosidase
MKLPHRKRLPLLAVISAVLALASTASDSAAKDTAAPIPDNAMTAAKTVDDRHQQALLRWNEAKFGLFLHWGPYAAYGGTYKGRDLWSAEWIQENARIPYAEYSKTALSWNPARFDADAWVRVAKQAGMGYIVVTARHHDGFAIYPSKASRYNLMSSGAYKGPDPLAALKAACAKHGLLFGIYYSPLEFRSSPKGFDEEDEKAVAAGFDYRSLGPKPYATNAQVVALAQAQIKELAEWYRPDILWFDGTWNKMGTWTAGDALEAQKVIRATIPEVLVNNRLGTRTADFDTYENKIPARPPGVPWEYCWNLGAFWGYNPRNYTRELLKTPDHYIETLVHVSSLGGNYLLNVGPDAEGSIHPMAIEYLEKIGSWVRANSEAVCGTLEGPFKEKPSWGYVTMKNGALYLIVKGREISKDPITIPALKNRLRGASLLHAPGSSVPVATASRQWRVGPITNPKQEPFVVIRLRVEGLPVAEN